MIAPHVSVTGKFCRVIEKLSPNAVKASRFLASIIGATLLVLGRALQRRIDAAYYLTLGLLAAAVIVSLMKGFDYHLASALTLLLVALLPCKKYFYRHGRLLSPSGDPAWFAAVTMTAGSVIWLILFSYQHVEYEHDLWWSFTYQGHASRSLRAAVGAAFATETQAFVKIGFGEPAQDTSLLVDLSSGFTVVNTEKEVTETEPSLIAGIVGGSAALIMLVVAIASFVWYRRAIAAPTRQEYLRAGSVNVSIASSVV